MRSPHPPGTDFSQISFSDVVIDPDVRVRRVLMLDFLTEEILKGEIGKNLGENIDNRIDDNATKQPIFSLGTELALRYLAQYKDLAPADSDFLPSDLLQIGDIIFEPIEPNFGGYQNANTAGYQIFLHYRSPENVASIIRFTDVLNNNFDPNLVKDKIVFIGSTSDNSRNAFFNLLQHRRQSSTNARCHAARTGHKSNSFHCDKSAAVALDMARMGRNHLDCSPYRHRRHFNGAHAKRPCTHCLWSQWPHRGLPG